MPPTLSTFCSNMTSISRLSCADALPRRALNRSMLIRVRQEREVTRALDRRRQLPLIRRAGPCDPTRNDLAGLRDIGLQRREILVVDLLHAFGREATKLLPSKITSHAPVPFLRVSLLCHY